MPQKRPPTICLAMIVRDEAPVIARCLESVRPFITHWTICDTGSIDDTGAVILATMAGIPGQLFHHAWRDFGHNKTRALDVARAAGCEYVLMIDADETLVTNGPDVFADLSADAYRLEMWFPTIHYPRLNLMRSTHNWRYVGTIHEYPTCEPRVAEILLDPAKVHMWTDGQGARGRSGTKTERDIAVMEQATRDDPANPRYWFYLAQAYGSVGRVEDAVRAYTTRTKMGDYLEEVWYSHYHLGHLACAADEWPTAVTHYLDAYACLPGRVEPLFWLAVGYQNRGMHHIAMLFVRQAITLEKPSSALFLEPDIYDNLRWIQYALALHHTGQAAEAGEMARKVIAEHTVPAENMPMMQQISGVPSVAVTEHLPTKTAQVTTTAAVAIIIPTMDNKTYLEPCLQSIIAHTDNVLYRIHVINNGAADSCDWIDFPQVSLSQPGRNLDWHGALQCGLDATTEPLVLFLNDDTFVPPSSRNWLHTLASHMVDPTVGAVGPSSNYVAGPQSIRYETPYDVFKARFLIGFCMLVRRTALDCVGNIDLNLPIGDDVDISLRLRDAGYTLVGDKTVFVQHHGSTTGERVHGTDGAHGAWNSAEWQQWTFGLLSAKHGQEKINECWVSDPLGPHYTGKKSHTKLNIGCSDALLDGYTNVDITPGQGITVVDLREPWPWPDGSVGEVRAAHIIEHLPDKVFTMNELWRVLEPGGKAIIDVPTTDGSGAWQDPTHVSFWNRRSFLYFESRNIYRERFARAYGVRAEFVVLSENLQETMDGPSLTIVLSAVK